MPDTLRKAGRLVQATRRPRGPAVPPAGAIAEAFGLTPAESRLVAALVRGGTLVEAAKRNGITINTAKTQLASVFLETGHQRQADLIAAVLGNPVLRLLATGG